MKYYYPVILASVVLVLVVSLTALSSPPVYSFGDCVAAGYIVLDTEPRKCIMPDGFVLTEGLNSALEVQNFHECAAAGYPVLESYPEQCRTPDGKLFVNKP